MIKKLLHHPIVKNRNGFSLAEVLIVVAIAASVVVVVSNLGGNVNLLNNLVSQQLQSASDINQTLQIMTTEIRSAGTAGNGAYPIDSASTSSFAFYSDINKNGSVEHVRYYLSSSTIYKGVIQATGTPATYPTSSEVITDIIDNVVTPTTSTPLFSYYDANYSGTQAAMTSPITIQSIRLVGISFRADVKPQQAPGPDYFSILVDIRNLRSN
jgi:prepilin-type N-terminal cleavage/methylation domain-containing protein